MAGASASADPVDPGQDARLDDSFETLSDKSERKGSLSLLDLEQRIHALEMRLTDAQQGFALEKARADDLQSRLNVAILDCDNLRQQQVLRSKKSRDMLVNRLRSPVNTTFDAGARPSLRSPVTANLDAARPNESSTSLTDKSQNSGRLALFSRSPRVRREGNTSMPGPAQPNASYSSSTSPGTSSPHVLNTKRSSTPVKMRKTPSTKNLRKSSSNLRKASSSNLRKSGSKKSLRRKPSSVPPPPMPDLEYQAALAYEAAAEAAAMEKAMSLTASAPPDIALNGGQDEFRDCMLLPPEEGTPMLDSAGPSPALPTTPTMPDTPDITSQSSHQAVYRGGRLESGSGEHDTSAYRDESQYHMAQSTMSFGTDSPYDGLGLKPPVEIFGAREPRHLGYAQQRQQDLSRVVSRQTITSADQCRARRLSAGVGSGTGEWPQHSFGSNASARGRTDTSDSFPRHAHSGLSFTSMDMSSQIDTDEKAGLTHNLMGERIPMSISERLLSLERTPSEYSNQMFLQDMVAEPGHARHHDRQDHVTAETMETLIEEMGKLVRHLQESDLESMERRLKRQNLPSQDVGLYSAASIQELTRQVSGMKPKYRDLLNEVHDKHPLHGDNCPPHGNNYQLHGDNYPPHDKHHDTHTPETDVVGGCSKPSSICSCGDPIHQKALSRRHFLTLVRLFRDALYETCRLRAAFNAVVIDPSSALSVAGAMAANPRWPLPAPDAAAHAPVSSRVSKTGGGVPTDQANARSNLFSRLVTAVTGNAAPSTGNTVPSTAATAAEPGSAAAGPIGLLSGERQTLRRKASKKASQSNFNLSAVNVTVNPLTHIAAADAAPADHDSVFGVFDEADEEDVVQDLPSFRPLRRRGLSDSSMHSSFASAGMPPGQGRLHTTLHDRLLQRAAPRVRADASNAQGLLSRNCHAQSHLAATTGAATMNASAFANV